MEIININDKADVLRALAERRASAPEKIDDASLPAGSPLHYYCHMCGHLTATKPEGWFMDPPPKFCDFCTRIREAGWHEL